MNGAHRWFLLGPASFQPSELAKLALCLFAATYLARRAPPRTLGELMKPLGIVTALFCGLIVLEPDLGTTISLSVMVLAILLVAGTPLRLLATASILVTVVGLAAIWIEPYRRARVFSFLDPWSDAQGSGFQIVQAAIGIGSGGFTGVGLGEGPQKALYLPEAHTDMIFAVVGEELGLIGSVARHRRVRGLRVRRVPGRPPVPGSVREAARSGHHGARLRPGRDQPRGRPRDRPAHGHSAPVRLLRRLEPRRPPRRGGHSP